MKKKHFTSSRFQVISQKELASIIGGDDDDEYITVIIDGVAYRIRINKNGQPTSAPERIG
ncbi:hypothetical protein SDC9_178961 [bioreactor metagenome]|uniref:Bacteriocin n=1 Tax=bioreactor metagenome TaxID=1076179 RepID=A0A645GXM7_9ZZZZ|nr:bacteriocin [Proteiniphilum sp.]MEA4918955.1 bacteriocin [Proteiniphilum sp.]